jgi:hypothetical protein
MVSYRGFSDFRQRTSIGDIAVKAILSIVEIAMFIAKNIYNSRSADIVIKRQAAKAHQSSIQLLKKTLT